MPHSLPLHKRVLSHTKLYISVPEDFYLATELQQTSLEPKLKYFSEKSSLEQQDTAKHPSELLYWPLNIQMHCLLERKKHYW